MTAMYRIFKPASKQMGLCLGRAGQVTLQKRESLGGVHRNTEPQKERWVSRGRIKEKLSS